jgi:hypothetical protein
VGFLDDLKKQAQAVRMREKVRRSLDAENVQVVEDAMRRSFSFLDEVLQHLKVIKPANPVVYRLPGIGDLRDLAYGDSFVSYRTKRVVDKDYCDRIELFIVWSAADDLVVERDMPAAAEQVRNLLWRANVRFSEDSEYGPNGNVLLTRFTIPRSVRMAITLRPDYVERRLVVIAKNLLRTGADDFAFPAQACDDALLDDLGRLLIGQPSEFRRYRTLLALDSWVHQS